jgi:hypothetical protein
MSLMLFIGCFDSTLALYTMNSLFFQILKLSEVLLSKSRNCPIALLPKAAKEKIGAAKDDTLKLT